MVGLCIAYLSPWWACVQPSISHHVAMVGLRTAYLLYPAMADLLRTAYVLPWWACVQPISHHGGLAYSLSPAYLPPWWACV